MRAYQVIPFLQSQVVCVETQSASTMRQINDVREYRTVCMLHALKEGEQNVSTERVEHLETREWTEHCLGSFKERHMSIEIEEHAGRF
jgi:hypothetical protein